MEELVRNRRPIRFMFEELEKELDELLKAETVDVDRVSIAFEHFNECCNSLAKHDDYIKAWMLTNNATEETENQEYSDLLQFKSRAAMIRRRVTKLGVGGSRESSMSTEAAGSSSSLSQVTEIHPRNYKLPQVELKKFNGDLREWIRFWDQFRKIDEDQHLDGSDKFFYLLQSMEPKSDAYDVVAVYPQSKENYPKAVMALKERFGNPDLLLQVYVRELLTLVISNVTNKEKTPLKNLYTKLDSHLNALETLNLQSADPSTWLFPLVESSLPENVLLAWKQKMSDGEMLTERSGNRLEQLMKFMKRQVEITQSMEMTKTFTTGTTKAVTGGKSNEGQRRFFPPTRRPQAPAVPLFHVADSPKCVFCNRNNHEPDRCFFAKKMTMEEKRSILLDKRRCFRCCGPHFATNCDTEGLKCQICGSRHLTVLCSGKRPADNPKATTVKKPRFLSSVNREGNFTNQVNQSYVALQTLLAEIVIGNKKQQIRIFFDNGSQRSYLLKKTADEFGLCSKGTETVVHEMFGGIQTKSTTHRRFDVILQRLFSNFCVQIEVRDQSKICNNLCNAVEVMPKLKEELRRREIQVVDDETGRMPIQLLIGADYYGQFLTGNKVNLDCGLVAIETILGWTVLGKEKEENPEENSVAVYMNMNISDANVTQLWELENLGISDPVQVQSEEEKENEAKRKFFETLRRNEDGRYSVRLPWKSCHPPLPSYKEVCRVRMLKAYEKLEKSGLVQEYGKLFKSWKAERFIEEDFDNMTPGHYVPHRPVVKLESKTTPIRPVFNASFKTGSSPSLNDCLHKGTNYIQKIPEILLRFREKKIGFVSDIRKAFQMIEVAECDRDATRFLWKENGKEVHYRHARVMFGATCSPFILGAVLEHFLAGVQDQRRRTALKLLQSFYVDNSVASVDTVEEYQQFKQISVKLMEEIQMDLRMWYSSADYVETEEKIIPVLGMNWDREMDHLFLKVKEMPQPQIVTKKVVLSCVQRIFDIIGIASPVLLPMKLLLQRAWVNKLSWDEPLPEEEEKSFRMWLEDMKILQEIRIPRLFTGGNDDRQNWSVHVFCDASQIAYGSVVFLRTEGENGVSVQLLDSKCKVAPLKKATIPRLELLGCCIGTRISRNIKRALELQNVPFTFWSDSSTALAWIKRNEQWGTFVWNRAIEIRKFTSVSDWRHVPGIVNPADVVSRGCSPYDLLESRWWEGPEWLRSADKNWPNLKLEVKEEEVVAELKKSATPVIHSMTIMDNVRADHSFRSQIRIMGWIQRFIKNCRVKARESRTEGMLSGEELRDAERFLIKSIQMEYYPEEMRKSLKGLDVMEDEFGILRVKTRLVYRDDDDNFKYPAILPGKDTTVRRLIMDTHQGYCHAGAGFLVAKLREKYWIVHSRKTVLSVISKCVRCRRLKAKPVVPENAPLPLERVQDSTVFETVGVDLFGPLNLKNGNKIWVVIFTCAVYRAVHFEVVTSISSLSFVAALKRFIVRFRRPKTIHCDNGTNFRGADKLFRKLEWSEIKKYEDLSPIIFKFSPPNSSWWGGYWERLIRSAKDLIKRTIGNGSCNRKELDYLLEATAGVMNGRPLTYISETPEDLEPLTPNHFIHPWGSVSFPEAELTEAQKLRFRFTYVKKLQQELKERFRKEYLSMLVSRNKKKASGKVKVGDLVFVGSDNKKRTAWPLGKVQQLFPGKDGVCRVAEVKTETGVFLRSLQNLYPLELEESTTENEEERVAGVTRYGRVVRPPMRYAAN